jgi:hypothetical protein
MSSEHNLSIGRKLIMNSGSEIRVILGVVGLIFTMSTGTASALADNEGNFEVVPPNSVQFGNTYGEWSARWRQCLVSIPAATNPNLDPTGANCALGKRVQYGFLAGTFGAVEGIGR